MALALNQLCFDLVQEWILKNPQASMCTPEGVNDLSEIVVFQDYYGLPEFRNLYLAGAQKANWSMDVCGDHRIRMACRGCEHMNFDCKEVYKKKLTANDMRESSRLYIMDSAARIICPQAFVDPPSNETKEPYINGALSFCDTNFNRLPMSFQRRRSDNKCYLIRGWRKFVEAEGLKEGHVIKISEYTNRGTGATFFTIGGPVLLFGKVFG